MSNFKFIYSLILGLFLSQVSFAQSDSVLVKLAEPIDDLVFQTIQEIASDDLETAFIKILEAKELFSSTINSDHKLKAKFDDSKLSALHSQIWNHRSLSDDIKYNHKHDSGERHSDKAKANPLKSDSLWNLAYSDYYEASLYGGDEKLAIKVDEAWENMTFDDQVESYMAPFTNRVMKVIFFELTIKEAGEFKSVLISANSESSNAIKVPFVLMWLLFGAILFTLYFRFISVTGFRHAIDVVRGKFDNPNKKEAGEVSHFQALTAALSGTVGVGNIAGVAIAVSIGGPGATFWMIVAGLLGMSAKFIECTLGTKYRIQNSDGSVSGGPMYYLSNGLAKKGAAMGHLGKVLAVLFAVACIGGSLGGGNMVQINQATKQLLLVTGGDASFLAGQSWMFGAVMAVVVGLIIIGGIKSIAKVTDKVVPFMVGIYVLGALVVLGGNFSSIPGAFGQILSGAFDSGAMYGGIIGVLIQGFKRAAFSNEAGIGSASIAHSAAKTDEPISEGMVSLLEPFIDTVVICTMTALVIIISGYGSLDAAEALSRAKSGDLQAVELTSSAFAQTMSWFPIVLSIAVILFALSTMISWSYYGLKAWTYLFGESKIADISYKAIFCVFVVVGSAISAQSVFDFGDAMIFAMCFPNVLGLFILAPEVKADLKDYLKRVKSGEIVQYKK